MPAATAAASRPVARDAAPVLCAVDDDALAADVLATAAALADRLNAPLTVVHSPFADTFVNAETHRLAIERGKQFLDRLTEGHRVDERIVEVDDPGRLITGLAREGASMIVVGSRRRTGLRAAILGSVSHAVIADAPCPVVTVSEFASKTVESDFDQREEVGVAHSDPTESVDWLQRPLA
jgi:nucleotide-binding universal stress UspA family protein